MTGGDGMAANKTGKKTGSRGKMPYSPSQSLHDWSDNLGGVSTLLKKGTIEQQQQQNTPQPVPPPPPTVAQKEKVCAGGEPKEAAGSAAASSGGTPGNGDDGSGGSGGNEHSRLEELSEKAADYVRRKRIDDIKTRLSKDLLVYQSIRARNICETKATNLMGGGAAYAPAVPGMVELGDGPMMTGGLKMALSDKRVITTSINFNWTCLVCDQHKDKPALRLRGEAGSGATQAIILADQNYPAILPVSSTEQCFKIIRIENGSLLELTDELLNLVGNRRIPPGSMVLLLSTTHLANVGLSAYIADHLQAARMIQDRFGKETRVAPLPPLLLAGCGDSSVVREVLEFLAWAADYYQEKDCYLEESFELAKKTLIESGTGEQTELALRRYRLPAPGGDNEKLVQRRRVSRQLNAAGSNPGHCQAGFS
jgi:hypothetical protein